MRPAPTAARRGFTLTELLVAAALILFVMAILAQCFQTGLGAMSNLKIAGQLQVQLRTATTALRRDLALPHFGDEDGGLVSEQRMDQADWTPPRRGYFRIWQGTPGVYEGQDADGLPSYRATDHYLAFTVKMDGAGRDSVFTSNSKPLVQAQSSPPFLRADGIDTLGNPRAGGTFTTPWAEVAYFLRDTGRQTEGGDSIFALHRRQRLLLDLPPGQEARFTPTADLPPSEASTTYADLSYWLVPGPPAAVLVNTPSTVTAPVRRFGMRWTGSLLEVGGQPSNLAKLKGSLPTLADATSSFGTTTPAAEQAKGYGSVGPDTAASGDDLVLTNVLSMDVKAMWDTAFADTTATFPALEVYPHSTSTGLPATVQNVTGSNYAGNLDAPFANIPRPVAGAVGSLTHKPRNPAFDPANVAANKYARAAVFDTWCGADVRAMTTTGTGAAQPVIASDPNKFAAYAATTPNNVDQEASTDPRRAAWNAGYFKPTAATNATAGLWTIPVRIHVRAVQIRLRIYDPKTKVARQVTVVQDL